MGGQSEVVPVNRLLQCVAVCCSALQLVICAKASVLLNVPSALRYVCCSVLQCVAVCCSVLQCVAVCCSVLQLVICAKASVLLNVPSAVRCVCCRVLQCVAVCCSALQCVALCCHSIQKTATYSGSDTKKSTRSICIFIVYVR